MTINLINHLNLGPNISAINHIIVDFLFTHKDSDCHGRSPSVEHGKDRAEVQSIMCFCKSMTIEILLIFDPFYGSAEESLNSNIVG